MYKPYFFLNAAYKTDRGEDLQSLPKAHQLTLQLEIWYNLDAEMRTRRYLFDDLLRVMDRLGTDIRRMVSGSSYL